MWVIWTFFSLMCSHSSLSHKLFVYTCFYWNCLTGAKTENWHLSANNQKHYRPLTKKMWEYLFRGHHRVHCSDYQRLKMLKDQCLLTLSAEVMKVSCRGVGVNNGNTATLPRHSPVLAFLVVVCMVTKSLCLLLTLWNFSHLSTLSKWGNCILKNILLRGDFHISAGDLRT